MISVSSAAHTSVGRGFWRHGLRGSNNLHSNQLNASVGLCRPSHVQRKLYFLFSFEWMHVYVCACM